MDREYKVSDHALIRFRQRHPHLIDKNLGVEQTILMMLEQGSRQRENTAKNRHGRRSGRIREVVVRYRQVRMIIKGDVVVTVL